MSYRIDPKTGDFIIDPKTGEFLEDSAAPVAPLASQPAPSASPTSVTPLQRIAQYGYSAASPEDKELFDASYDTSQAKQQGIPLDQVRQIADQQAKTPKQEAQPDVNSVGNVLMPATSAGGASPWNVVKDVGSLPLRGVAGIGAGAGELAGRMYHGMVGPGVADIRLPTTDDLAAARDAAVQGVRNPTESVATSGDASNLARMGAAAAENPATLPLILTPGGWVVQGLKAGAAAYGEHALDRAEQIRQEALANPAADQSTGHVLRQTFGGETGGQILEDVAPLAAGGVLTGAGKLGAGLLRSVGQGGIDAAYNLAARILKAAPGVNSGAEWEGLQTGLRGAVVPSAGAGAEPIFPKLFTPGTFTKEGVVSNYDALKDVYDARFDPLREKLTEAGVTVDPQQVFEQASEGLRRQRIEQRLPVNEQQQEKAEAWLKGILNNPTTASEAAWREGILSGAEPSGGVGKLASYKLSQPAPYPDLLAMGRTGMPEETVPAFVGPYTPTAAHVTGSNLAKEAFKNLKNITAKSAIADEARQAFRSALTHPESVENPAIPRQSVLYINGERMSNPHILANSPEGAALLAKEGKTPEEAVVDAARRNLSRAEWAQQLANAHPIYAMEAALERARRTGGNSNPLSLPSLVGLSAAAGGHPGGLAVGLGSILQESPALASALYGFGTYTKPFMNNARGLAAGLENYLPVAARTVTSAATSADKAKKK